jgi:hypothetical protein
MKSRLSLRLLFFSLLVIDITATVRAQNAGVTRSEEIPPLSFTSVDDLSAPTGWRRYQFGDPVQFGAVLPSQPGVHSSKSGTLTQHIYLAQNSETGTQYFLIYMVDTAVMTERRSDADAKRAFDDLMKGLAEGAKESLKRIEIIAEMKVDAERRIKISGIDGYEQEVSIGPLSGRAQAVFLGRTAYMAISFWPKGSSLNEPAAFFNSFQVRAK